MSGVGGPIPSAAPLTEISPEYYPEPVDVRVDLAKFERGAIARRIGAIVAQCQKEAREGTVPLSSIELRLAILADDVRGGLHGASE